MCKTIPVFHAFTGCDYSPSFAFKGKIRPFTFLAKNHKAQSAFAKLGWMGMLPDSVIDEIENFLCQMYGAKGIKSVDECRLVSFMKVYKPKKKCLCLR